MKTLRLGFAMGGGVSLGSFCGAALTESIKLILIDILSNPHTEYNDLVIDAFSGASAGAMSLAVMFRGLHAQGKDDIEKAKSDLKNVLPKIKPDHLDADAFKLLKNKLIAAQVAQNYQKQAWVDMVDILELIPKDSVTLPYQAGLLDRDCLNRIARKIVGTVTREDASCSLLADRVLFACTLANLSPMTADATAQMDVSDVSRIGLRDGAVSHYHSDLRVFNIVRNPLSSGISEQSDKVHPRRWVRLRGENVELDDSFSLKKMKVGGCSFPLPLPAALFLLLSSPFHILASNMSMEKNGHSNW